MKETILKIIDLCNTTKDEEDVLKDIAIKANNKLIRIEWLEKYGIELDEYACLAENDFHRIDSYQTISYFKDGYWSHENNCGRNISWPEGGKQPVNEWIYSISFPTGAYIFGNNYDSQVDLFRSFFEELRTYNPDYEDLHNNLLYWKIENAKKIKDSFKNILNKYMELNKNELKSRKIEKLKKELDLLTKDIK